MSRSGGQGSSGSRGVVIDRPTGFSFSKQFNVTQLGERFYCDLDIQALRPAAGVTYYVAPSPTGLAGNPGTLASPLSPGAALAKVDVGTIIFLPGEYFRNADRIGTITKSVNLLALGAGVKLTNWETPSNLTWTLQAGSIYQTSRSSTLSVIDKRSTVLTAWGSYPTYTKKADLASITGPGQWALVGSTVYVWALGNANLATDASFLRLSIDTGSGAILANGNVVVYAEGIDCEGAGNASVPAVGGYSSGAAGSPTLIAVDCSSRYSPASGSAQAQGAQFVMWVRFTCSDNLQDGFSYHSGTNNAAQTIVPEGIEIDCVSYRNGQTATAETQNGTTSHDGAKVVRLNGKYYENFGPNVADVLASKVWNLGCTGNGSLAVTNNAGFQALDAGTDSYCQDCTARGNLVAGNAANGGTLHVRGGSLAGGPNTQTNAGTVVTY